MSNLLYWLLSLSLSLFLVSPLPFILLILFALFRNISHRYLSSAFAKSLVENTLLLTFSLLDFALALFLSFLFLLN